MISVGKENITSTPPSNTTLQLTPECTTRDLDDNLPATIAYEVATLLICGFGMVANSLVLYVIRRTRELFTPINYFIFSLALSDLLQGLSFAPYTLAHHYEALIANWSHCCALLAIVTTAEMASALNLAGLLVARYLTIRYPLSQHTILTHTRVVAATVAVWLASLAVACGLHVKATPENYCGKCRAELFWGVYEIAGMMAFTETIPTVIMFTAFCLTTRAYAKHVRELARIMQTSGSRTDNTSHDVKAEGRLSRMTFFLITWFFISYLPFMVYTFMYCVCKHCYLSNYVRFLARLLLLSNIAVNFMAYVIGHDKFRHSLYNIVCPVQACRQKTSGAVSSSYIAQAASTILAGDSEGGL